MTRTRIGGPIDYDLLAKLNRPSDASGLRREALDMQRRGLTPLDSAPLLGITEAAVIALLNGAGATRAGTP